MMVDSGGRRERKMRALGGVKVAKVRFPRSMTGTHGPIPNRGKILRLQGACKSSAFRGTHVQLHLNLTPPLIPNPPGSSLVTGSPVFRPIYVAPLGSQMVDEGQV